MWAAVTYSGIRLVQMAQDVSIAFDTVLLAVLVLAVELRADVLPGGGGFVYQRRF